jgi:hypothetical protein
VSPIELVFSNARGREAYPKLIDGEGSAIPSTLLAEVELPSVKILAAKEFGPPLLAFSLCVQEARRGECHGENRNKHACDSMVRLHVVSRRTFI